MRLLCASVCMCGHSCSVFSGQCPFLLIVRRYIGFLHVTLLPCHFGAENQSNSFEMRGQLRNFKAEIMDDSVGGCQETLQFFCYAAFGEEPVSQSVERERARERGGGKVIEPFSQTVGADLADLLYIRRGMAGKYCVHGYRVDNISHEMSSYKRLHRLPSVMILSDKTELTQSLIKIAFGASKHRRRMKLCQHLYLKESYLYGALLKHYKQRRESTNRERGRGKTRSNLKLFKNRVYLHLSGLTSISNQRKSPTNWCKQQKNVSMIQSVNPT